MSIEEIIFRANQLCNEWQATQAAKIVSYVTNSPHPIAWRLPKQNALKCNADAAFIPESRHAGIAWIVRDQYGRNKGGKLSVVQGIFNLFLAEARGFREALSWVKDRGYDCPIEFETDSMMVVQAIQGLKVDNSYFGSIISYFKALLQELTSFSFSFVKKSANQCAHLLARAAISKSGFLEWGETPPNLISDVLSFDLINI
ncbi:hypothetical protein P3X46_018791 [Hevea brasiliensis]|uniref:RNase H type-1 domain-containing protein n=1 Tax=Hevea brasiliensis TaxID=3981 RepID=A0ABQ9LRR8_HEVBR|nr:hypothetical protein P3X46_018791 [Hevea brasiliensis]